MRVVFIVGGRRFLVKMGFAHRPARSRAKCVIAAAGARGVASARAALSLWAQPLRAPQALTWQSMEAIGKHIEKAAARLLVGFGSRGARLSMRVEGVLRWLRMAGPLLDCVPAPRVRAPGAPRPRLLALHAADGRPGGDGGGRVRLLFRAVAVRPLPAVLASQVPRRVGRAAPRCRRRPRFHRRVCCWSADCVRPGWARPGARSFCARRDAAAMSGGAVPGLGPCRPNSLALAQ